jgi:hypothetical protein
MERLRCHLHRPTNCSVALYRLAWPWTAFLWGRGAKPMGQTICLGVNRLGPWWIKSFTENPDFTWVSLSDIRVIMVITWVLMEELLCQTVMKRI